MSTLVNVSRVGLLLLCAAGYYGTWHLVLNNGTAKYMSHIRDVGPRTLPGSNAPLKTVYIGVPAIDYQLTVLTLFFWEIVDGSNPAASLFCFHFATQVACGWGLLMVEGLRRGHRWRILSFIGTMGVLVQNAAYAIVVPLYLIMYLSTSPLMSSKCKGNFLIDTSDTAAIPISIALGYVAPAILMSLPAPSVIDFQQKQTFMAIWQMFPLWVAILQAVLPYLTAAFLQDRTLSSKSSHSFEMKVLRYIYVMLLVVAGIGQTSTATLIAASKWFPDVFAPGFKGIFDFHKVFVPAAIYPSAMMPSIGSGALMLLQYDELIGSTSMALFATVMYISACQGIKTSRSVVSLVFQGLAIAIVTGPLGFAVACIWARDEIIVESDKGDVKKVD